MYSIRIFWLASLLLLSSCAELRKSATKRTGIVTPPPHVVVPVVEIPSTPLGAPLRINVVYPLQGQARPAVDSNFIFGSVGNGNATLTINGYAVPVARNGAFLAYLPMPSMKEAYQIVTHRGDAADSLIVAYHPEDAKARSKVEESRKARYEAFTLPRTLQVVKCSDTLQTGNDVAPGATTPDGTREWFFPRRTIVQAVGREGKYYKLELDKDEYAWVADSSFIASDNFTAKPRPGGVLQFAGYIDLLLPCCFGPFRITVEGRKLRVHVYRNVMHATFAYPDTSVKLVTDVGIGAAGQGSEYEFSCSAPIWGYKAFYDSLGSLVVRLRRPPNIDKDDPLRGLRIMIDPGHPPGGATGPLGLMEREANLAIATRLRDQLAARGVKVLITHTDLHGMVSDVNQVEELDARAALAVRENVDLMVSVHNNAFPDGTNPFLNYGTSTFYFHPQSADLAGCLDREIAQVTGVPNLGPMKKSLAVCRPTWMPCALTESLHMMFPEQEQALRDPEFLDALAAAHVRGIEDFVRERAQ